MSITGDLKFKYTLTGKISGAKMIYLDAYNIAVQHGFVGTVDEWLESLKGEDGKTPYIGANGHWFIGDEDTGVIAGGGGGGSSSSAWNAEITGYERTEITPQSFRVTAQETFHDYHPMEIGDTVYVTVNSTEYERKLVAQDFMGNEIYLYAGNLALNPSYTGQGSSEPFLFVISPEMGMWEIYIKAPSTVKVEWKKPVVKELLPARYLRYDYAPRASLKDLESVVAGHEAELLEASGKVTSLSAEQEALVSDVSKLMQDVTSLSQKNASQDSEDKRLSSEIEKVREELANFEPKEKPFVSKLDVSGWDSGSITETLSDGSSETLAVVFDENGNPKSVGGMTIVWGD